MGGGAGAAAMLAAAARGQRHAPAGEPHSRAHPGALGRGLEGCSRVSPITAADSRLRILPASQAARLGAANKQEIPDECGRGEFSLGLVQIFLPETKE